MHGERIKNIKLIFLDLRSRGPVLSYLIKHIIFPEIQALSGARGCKYKFCPRVAERKVQQQLSHILD
jgi:hypothetical protein